MVFSKSFLVETAAGSLEDDAIYTPEDDHVDAPEDGEGDALNNAGVDILEDREDAGGNDYCKWGYCGGKG